MKKKLALFIYLITLVATIALVFLINALTPQLSEDSTLPADIDSRIYALSLDEQPHRLYYKFPENENNLILLTSSSKAIERIDTCFVETEQYRHIYRIPLRQAVDSAGYVQLNIAPSSSSNEISTFLIGSENVIEQHFVFVEGLSNFFVGLHVMLMIIMLCLYAQKHSEKYLLTIFWLAVLSAFSFILVMPNPILSFPGQKKSLLNYFSSVIPLYVNFVLCISMMSWSNCKPLLKLSMSRGIAAATLILCLIGFFFSNQQTLIAGIIRWGTSVLIAVLIYLYQKDMKNTTILMGFAFSNGIGMAINLIKDLHLVCAGEIIIITRLSQLGRAAFLCLAAANIALRFSGKFAEAERLSIELNTLNASLDNQVAERTRELVRKDQQKHQFMLNIFHDLRSPILIARNCVESLEAGHNTPESLRVLQNSVDFMGRMTEDLFLSAKLEDNQLFLVMDKVNLSAVCCELVHSSGLRAEKKQLQMESTIDSDLFIWGDEMRVHQIIQNLIDNAIKYTPEGGRISVRLATAHCEYVLEIANSGSGIPKEKIPFIFDRYYSYARSSNRESTGLGLAIARDLVKLHRGSISVESEQDVRTVFTVRFPLLAADGKIPRNKSDSQA